MARLGVTYQDIANAANQLLGEGKQPTIELIRHFLKTGSSTTIANHLRKWRVEQDGTSGIAAKENVPQELIAIVKGLWERLTQQSQEKINVIEAKHQETLAHLQQELQKYKNNNQRWQQLFNQWSQEKTQLTNDKLSLEQGIDSLLMDKNTLQGQLDAKDHQLDEKQERIAELVRLHQQAQANLEHYRETMREQRLIEQHQFEQQKQEWQTEIKVLKEQATIMREKTTALQQQYQLLQQTHGTLEVAHIQVKNKLESQSVQLNAIEKAKNEQTQASLHWQTQCNEVQGALERTTSKLIDIQTEFKISLKQIKDIEQKHHDTMEQNKLLGHEKWLLAQEKSQLEGELKQLQKMVKTA